MPPKKTNPPDEKKHNSKQQKHPELANRTFWLLILTGLLPSLVAALVSVQTQQSLLAKRTNNLQASANQLAQSFSSRLQQAAIELRPLVEDELMADPQLSTQKKLARMRRFLESSDIFDQLFLLGPTGKLLVSTGSEVSPSVLQRDWLKHIQPGMANVYGPVSLGDPQSQGLFLSWVIRQKPDAPAVVLVGFTSLDTLAVDMESFMQGQSGVAVLATADGQILAGSTPELVGRHIPVSSDTSGK